MVSAHDLTKKFGELTALESVEFEIPDGEFVFLTGASGSGKTTLLRLLIRDLIPTSGSLQVNGFQLENMPKVKLPVFRRSIGTVFQDFKLLPDLTIRENVALPLEVRGINTQDINKAVNIALEMVGLSSKGLSFPSQISGGELQRVGLARAVVGKPKLLLADEPTGNLDPKTAKTIVKLLKEVHSYLKTTVIMATHNSEIVNHYNLRVFTLQDGKLIKDSQTGHYDD